MASQFEGASFRVGWSPRRAKVQKPRLCNSGELDRVSIQYLFPQQFQNGIVQAVPWRETGQERVRHGIAQQQQQQQHQKQQQQQQRELIFRQCSTWCRSIPLQQLRKLFKPCRSSCSRESSTDFWAAHTCPIKPTAYSPKSKTHFAYILHTFYIRSDQTSRAWKTYGIKMDKIYGLHTGGVFPKSYGSAMDRHPTKNIRAPSGLKTSIGRL